jgi:hypothetical protein
MFHTQLLEAGFFSLSHRERVRVRGAAGAEEKCDAVPAM